MATIQRPHFSISCREELTEQAVWLAGVVESIATQGPGLVDGTTFQVGWSVLKLVQQTPGLALCEPDFDGNPFENYRNDVSTTLDVLSRQRALVARLGCAPLDIRFDDQVVLYKGCLDERGIYAERSEPDDGDSGWYLGSTREHDSPDEDQLEAIWVFQLLHKRPDVLSALCLPAGWMVVWDGADMVGVANEDNEEMLR